jgi:signal transduction histidine kinase
MEGDLIERIGSHTILFHHLLNDNVYIGSRNELFAWLEIKKQIFKELRKPEITLVVNRDGRELEVRAIPKKTRLDFLDRSEFLQFPISITFMVIGATVIWKGRTREESLVFFLMCSSIALILISNVTSVASELGCEPPFFSMMNLLNRAMYCFAGVNVLYFTLLIPEKRKMLVRRPWLAGPPYAAHITAAVSMFISIQDFIVATSFGLSLISAVYALFAYKPPVARQQMKWMTAGLLFGLGPWVLVNGLPMLFTGKGLISDNVPALFTVCIPLFMGFAVQKHRLFDVDVLFEGTFLYLLTFGLLAIVDVSFINLLNTHFAKSLAIDATARLLLPLLVVVSIYAPIRSKVNLFLRRLFGKSELNDGVVIGTFTSRALGQAPDGLVLVLEDAVRENFHPRRIITVRRDSGEMESILNVLGEQTELVRLWELERSLPVAYEGMYIALCIGIKEKTDAIILLAERSSGKFYSRNDFAVLRSLLRQANILYENSRLYKESMDQFNARLKEEKMHAMEKERILQDLHDGIGGMTVNINLLAEMAKRSMSFEDVRKSLSAISELSQESLAEIRSFMHSLDATKMDWQSLAADLRSFGGNMLDAHGIRFNFQTSIMVDSEKPDSLLCLVLFRIYKEALTNVVKHSKASAVDVALNIDSETVSLSIRDNGTGFMDGKGKGRGLANMHARARRLCGSLSVAAEKGVSITLRIPQPLRYLEDGLQNQ